MHIHNAVKWLDLILIKEVFSIKVKSFHFERPNICLSVTGSFQNVTELSGCQHTSEIPILRKWCIEWDF